MIISTDTEKAFDKTQHPFLIKILIELQREGNFFNTINAIYEKNTANIIFNGENMKMLPLRSRTRQGSPLSSLLSNTSLD